MATISGHPSLVIVGKRVADRPSDYQWGLYEYSLYYRGKVYSFRDNWRPIWIEKMTLVEFQVAYPIDEEVYEVAATSTPTAAAIRTFIRNWKKVNRFYRTWGTNSQLFVKEFLQSQFGIRIYTQTLQKVRLFNAIFGLFLAVSFLDMMWQIYINVENRAAWRAYKQEDESNWAKTAGSE